VVEHRLDLGQAGLPGPHQFDAQQRVDDEVAGRVRWRVAGHDSDHVEAEPARGGRGEADMVALRRTAGDQHVGAGGQRVRAEVVELADLVAAAGERGQVVALDP
jgi:hypothetical protein